MKWEDKDILAVLLKGSYLRPEEAKKAEAYVRTHHVPVAEYLLGEQLITIDLLGQAIAESFGVSYADLNSVIPSREQVLKIPEDVAHKHHAVVFRETDKEVFVATDDPSQKNLSDALKPIFPKKKVKLMFGHLQDIEAVFIHYRQNLEARFVKLLEANHSVAPEILQEILQDAVLLRASDIHFEPQERMVVIRFRIDGVMQEVGRIEKAPYENILNRIKVQAHLRTDEHQAAQDGAIRIANSDGSVDVRVSIVPTIDGEKVVLRLLAAHVRGWTLSDLGFGERDRKLVLEAAEKPYGMILVSGPTGSGKTTTLYGLLKFLNHPEVNIATIEDPVEYKISGVNHIQVNPLTNLTFAHGLRSIVRQDPDIILVGEIRDQETAEIAVNAALTGHLLLSTFHANDAAAAIPRLLNMGVEPFLLASTLNLILGQRLARRICDACRTSFHTTAEKACAGQEAVRPFLPAKKLTLYKGKGCSSCNGVGYRGRIVFSEAIRITPQMQELILRHPSANELWALARSQCAKTMFEDGMEKVLAGVTTLDELVRVAPPPARA